MHDNKSHPRQSYQTRSLTQPFETREEGGELYIEGYFAVFNSPYHLFEGATEIIKPGAFAKCLGQDVRALINHDTTLVLGRTKAGTFELREDDHGLWGRIKINRQDQDALNIHARSKRGDVNQGSFGFDIGKQTRVDLGGGNVQWEIEEVRTLYECSVCTFPAYEETGVSARKAELAEVERRKNELWKANMKKRIGGNDHGA